MGELDELRADMRGALEEALGALGEMVLMRMAGAEMIPIGPYGYGDKALEDAVLIFSHILIDKMWEMMEGEAMEQSDREAMASAGGDAIRALVKTYTGKDMKRRAV